MSNRSRHDLGVSSLQVSRERSGKRRRVGRCYPGGENCQSYINSTYVKPRGVWSSPNVSGAPVRVPRLLPWRTAATLCPSSTTPEDPVVAEHSDPGGGSCFAVLARSEVDRTTLAVLG